MPSNRQSAEALLIQMETLKEGRSEGNLIGTDRLLVMTLHDAERLARSVVDPLAKSRAAIAKSLVILAKYGCSPVWDKPIGLGDDNGQG